MGAIILQICYGYEIRETDDPFAKLAKAFVEQFSLACTPGAFMVDFIPACIYI